jgi:hypothetical protein
MPLFSQKSVTNPQCPTSICSYQRENISMSLGFQEYFKQEDGRKYGIEGILIEDSFQLSKLNWDVEIDMDAALASRVALMTKPHG